MQQERPIVPVRQPDRIASYFRLERWPLAIVCVSGVLYNFGMVAGPYFEGTLAQRLLDILGGTLAPASMLPLAATYFAVILAVQVLRAVKRFYVRRFANDTGRSMRHMLYNSLVNSSPEELRREELGAVMTKAVADVDACVEGMRKFTTELFDTGVVLVAYLALLFWYDWRLALLSCAFTPFAYLIAGALKGRVARCSADYKRSAERLNGATMDRVGNAVTYRVHGCEPQRDDAYEGRLADYEHRAVAANLWENTMQPLYNAVSMCGAALIFWFGAKNVLGTGWTVWDIAAFTTFLSCFTKMALKSSKAAKLFNAVQKAEVSWQRVKPLLREYREPDTACGPLPERPALAVEHLALRRPDGSALLENVSFAARPGQIIGITGPVACGKSTLGRVFIGEVPYEGSVQLGGRELRTLTEYERTRLVSYMGHAPELMSDTVAENVCLGASGDPAPFLRDVRLDGEIAAMPDGADTYVGSGGVRLSGGQQARTALARTLFSARDLLVLDDPFSAVDAATETEILEAVRALAAGKIVLLFSHRLTHFPKFDGVLYLEDGRAAFGSHAALLERCPGYAELYRRQTSGGEQDAQ